MASVDMFTLDQNQMDRLSELNLEQLIVQWKPYDWVHPNQYNPNKMTWHDRQLLRQSLLEDGWTQPIVVLPDGTIVDGEQRWTTAGLDIEPALIEDIIETMHKRHELDGIPISESILERLQWSRIKLMDAINRGLKGTIAAITDGKVPITVLDLKDDAHKMIATIRHNRARGTHKLDSMSSITADLMKLGLNVDDLELRLGMEEEEIARLIETVELPDLLDIHEPTEAWIPVHVAGLTDDELAKKELDRSAAASAAAAAYQRQLATQKKTIDLEAKAAVQAKEADLERSLTQDEKDKIEAGIKKSMTTVAAPEAPELKKMMFFITPDEYDIIMAVLGEPPVQGLIKLCKREAERMRGDS